MGRLIDADALLEDMRTFKDNCESIGITPNWEHANRIIKEQPTAFSVEAVVAKLEQQAEQYQRRALELVAKSAEAGMHNKGKALSYEHAIEIVRGKE